MSRPASAPGGLPSSVTWKRSGLPVALPSYRQAPALPAVSLPLALSQLDPAAPDQQRWREALA